MDKLDRHGVLRHLFGEGIDKSDQEYQEFVYPDGSVYRIDNPKTVYIFEGKSGWTQRIIDQDGVTHRPTPGWNAIRWKPRPGCAAFHS